MYLKITSDLPTMNYIPLTNFQTFLARNVFLVYGLINSCINEIQIIKQSVRQKKCIEYFNEWGWFYQVIFLKVTIQTSLIIYYIINCFSSLSSCFSIRSTDKLNVYYCSVEEVNIFSFEEVNVEEKEFHESHMPQKSKIKF